MAPSSEQIAPTVPRAIRPSTWLFALTGSLLLGQLAAASPVVLSADLVWLLLVPLVLLIDPLAKLRWLTTLIAGRDVTSERSTITRNYQARALLAMVVGSMFALGYFRHHQLLFPTFPPNHLRSVMNENNDFFLEGVLLHEPERLPNRSRWYLRAERIWHLDGRRGNFR